MAEKKQEQDNRTPAQIVEDEQREEALKAAGQSTSKSGK